MDSATRYLLPQFSLRLRSDGHPKLACYCSPSAPTHPSIHPSSEWIDKGGQNGCHASKLFAVAEARRGGRRCPRPTNHRHPSLSRSVDADAKVGNNIARLAHTHSASSSSSSLCGLRRLSVRPSVRTASRAPVGRSISPSTRRSLTYGGTE